MISFQEFGQWGRFGNQLFEYAFLRSTARRLGVKFYCPQWIGDKVFHLDDGTERASAPVGITKKFTAPAMEYGFVRNALEIKDGTDITGFFQSEKYYDDKEAVRHWFRFIDDITRIKKDFQSIDFSDSVSLSVRMGDYNDLRYIFPLPSIGFYRKALQRVGDRKHVLVFSDEPDHARDYFHSLDDGNMVFIEGPTDLEQFYLITQCRDNILANSSFAWWGAWLNSHSDKTVIAPNKWYRPGCGRKSTALFCDGWQTIQSSTPIVEHYYIWLLRRQIGWKINRISRLLENT